MKQLIRLTESDLHNIIRESVNRVLVERRGYVPNDGNGMVGGYYDSWDESGTQNIATLYKSIFDDCAYDANLDEDTFNAVNEYIDSNEDVFDITAHFDVSYDESTGWGNAHSPIYELKEIDKRDVEGIKQFIRQFQGDERVIGLMLQALDKTLDSVDEGDFDFGY